MITQRRVFRAKPGASGAVVNNLKEFQPIVERGGGPLRRIYTDLLSGETDRVVWEFDFASDQHLLHHDIEILPNGNILAIAWEAKTADQVGAAGGDPATMPPSGLWPDMVIEIEPQRPNGGRVAHLGPSGAGP